MNKEEMTLDELKAQNAAAEEAETQELETSENAVQDEETNEEESANEGQENANEEAQADEQTQVEESEVPLYLQTDEQEEGDAKFTDSDVANLRRKLKSKLSDKDEEIEQLKKQLAASQQSAPQQQTSTVPPKPTLEQFEYDQDKYEEALEDWRDKKAEARFATKQREQELRQQQEAQRQQSQEALDSHYDRVGKLFAKGELTPDKYEVAEKLVRSTIGDELTDQLISVVGEGSEKVVTYLGVNQKARREFEGLLKTNPIAASVKLGELKAQVNSTAKKISKAPKPSAKLNQSQTGGSSASAYKSKYNNAKDAQARFRIYQEAKAKGINIHD